MSKVAVMGFHEGNAGQVATWFEDVTGMQIACFFEEGDAPPIINPEEENRNRISQRMEYPTESSFKGRPFFVSRDWPERLRKMGVSKVLPLTSDNLIRRASIRRCLQAGLELVSAIHPTAIVLDQAEIQPGVWINAGAIIGYKCELHSGVMVNTGAQVDHHSILESCCQLDPAVVTAGHVTIRECAHLHTNATVINKIEIGREAIVGAGAVVIRDVPVQSTVVGVPARVIKQRG